LGRGTAAFMDLIWVKREGKYFCDKDWTVDSALIGFEKFVFWRNQGWPIAASYSVSLIWIFAGQSGN
jgi:hypothetical protein